MRPLKLLARTLTANNRSGARAVSSPMRWTRGKVLSVNTSSGTGTVAIDGDPNQVAVSFFTLRGMSLSIGDTVELLLYNNEVKVMGHIATSASGSGNGPYSFS
jgi:hypothetical protein